MSLHRVVFAAVLFTAAAAQARIGETEAQSQTRYGTPTPELIGANDKPLVEGAKEVAYNFEGWRVRAAFIGAVTAKIEYIRIPVDGKLKPISDAETVAILEAEKGAGKWREKIADKRDFAKAIQGEVEKATKGRFWERTDHTMANLGPGNIIFVFETPAVEDFEKKRAKELKANPGAPKPGVPKF